MKKVAARFFCPFAFALVPIAALAQSPKAIAVAAIDDEQFDYASVNTSLDRFFLGTDSGVFAMGLKTYSVSKYFPEAGMIHAVIALPGARILATNGDKARVIIADAQTGKVDAYIPAGRHPDAAVVLTGQKQAAVFSKGDNRVTFIDLQTNTAAASMILPGSPEFAADDGRGHIFVNLADLNAIGLISDKSRTLVMQIPLRGCKSPSGLAYDAERHMLVTVCDNGAAIVVNAMTHKQLGSVWVGGGADAVLFDDRTGQFLIPCADNRRLYAVAVSRSGRARVVRQWSTGSGVRTGAVDNRDGKVFLPSVEYGHDTIQRYGQSLPAPVKGSGRLLMIRQ